MTPEVTVYKVLHELVATTSLCIPGVNLSQERMEAGKSLPQCHHLSGEGLRHVPHSLLGGPSGECAGACSGHQTLLAVLPFGSPPRASSGYFPNKLLAPKPWRDPRQWPHHALFWSLSSMWVHFIVFSAFPHLTRSCTSYLIFPSST